jgi:hypothetical protein
MSRQHNAVKKLQHKYMHKTFWKCARLKDSVTTLRNQTCMHKEIESRKSSERICYYLVHKHLPSSLQSKS